jgi:uncharacterized phage protein (TIGR02218 family)
MSDLTTTRARAWRLERADGLVLGFTDHDRDLSFGGAVFRAGAGLSAKALSQATGLAVDNTEAAGALTDAGLTETDILAGRWDGARLTIWEVDWADTGVRRVLFRGSLGEIARQGGAFRAELRGLTEALQQGGGRVFGAVCPAVLGDGRCRFDLTTPGYAHQATLVEVAPEGGELVVAAAEAPAPPGWFAEGRVRFLDGRALGLTAVVRADLAQAGLRRLALWAAPGVQPGAGDRVRIEAGCDKRLATCRDRFGNVANFQGFPHLPGDDWLFTAPQPGATGGRREPL